MGRIYSTMTCMMTAQHLEIETRVNHGLDDRQAVACANGHEWNADVQVVNVGQLAVVGQGVSMRSIYSVAPGNCPTCGNTWKRTLEGDNANPAQYRMRIELRVA